MKLAAATGTVLALLLGLVSPALALDVRAAPTEIRFADPVVVTATGSGPIGLELGPWTALGSAVTTTSDGETVVTLRVVCLTDACLPGASPKSVPLPVATSAGSRSAARIVVAARVDAATVAAAKGAYRRDSGASAYEGHRAVTIVALVFAAVAFCAAAALLLSGRKRNSAAAFPRQDARARALRLLRESAGRPASDRRRAADLVSRVVPSAAVPAAGVAWSRPDPRSEDVEELAATVEAEL